MFAKAIGATGATGIGTTIVGEAESVEQLEREHPEGPATDAYIINGVIYIWNETEGWHSAGSLQGPTGVTGIGTTIVGEAESVAWLEQEHPDGPATDAYLIDGVLYIWNETEGWHSAGSIQGPTGATGSNATSATIIPFCSQAAPLSYTSNGVSTRVSLLGFGYSDSRLGADYSIVLNASDQSFSLDGVDNHQLVFSLPFNMTLRSIYGTFGNWEGFNPTGSVYPYVQIYTAQAGSNTFMPLVGATAIPTNALGPGTTQANTMVTAANNTLEIPLTAGTRIAIGALVRETATTTNSYFLYYTGAMGLTLTE